MRRNEWHKEPNDWQSVGYNATWEGAIKKFRALTDESVARAVEQAYRASGQDLRTREFVSLGERSRFKAVHVLFLRKKEDTLATISGRINPPIRTTSTFSPTVRSRQRTPPPTAIMRLAPARNAALMGRGTV